MKSDRIQGAFWIALGLAIFYASWTMDRLANLGVKPFSAPGLLPGVLGVFIVLLGLAMLLRARQEETERIDWRRIFLPLALCLVFAGGMVGRGIPFWLAASVAISLIFQELFLIRLP